MTRHLTSPIDDMAERLPEADPLAHARDVVDPPVMRELRRQREVAAALGHQPGGAVAQALEAQEKITRQLGGGGFADRFRSPVGDALDALGMPRGSVVPPPPARLPPTTQPARQDRPEAVQSVADIGKRVRAARRAMGMTQQRFADLAGVGRRFLVELERGKPSLEIDRVLAVCKAAGIGLAFTG